MIKNKINPLRQQEINVVGGGIANDNSAAIIERLKNSPIKGTNIVAGCGGAYGCYVAGTLQYDVPLNKHFSIAPYIRGNNFAGINGGGIQLRWRF